MAQTSIGERLRQAREAIPASLTEASRATRVRVDYLEAMERDSFTFVSGRVYVVGMLRSYARWLRLDDRAIAAEFDRIYGAPDAPALAESLATRREPRMPSGNPRKPQWAMAGAAAFAILVVLLLFSLLGGGGNVAPPAIAPPPTPTPTAGAVVTPTVTATSGVQLVVAVWANRSWVHVSVGDTTPELLLFQGTLQQGVTRTFSAPDFMRIQLDNPGAVRLTVNGKDLGSPTAAQAYSFVVKPDASLEPDPAATLPPQGQRNGPVVFPPRASNPPARPPPSPTPTPAPPPTPSPSPSSPTPSPARTSPSVTSTMG